MTTNRCCKPKRSSERPPRDGLPVLMMADQKGKFMRTYEQDLRELNITVEEFDNVISNIYDKTADEMVAISRSIKLGAKVLPVVKRAFERVLAMRQEERKVAYDIYYSDLNVMCFNCKNLGNGCNGTTCKTWTGCVYIEK